MSNLLWWKAKNNFKSTNVDRHTFRVDCSVSYCLQALKLSPASPLLGVFPWAVIWRQTQSGLVMNTMLSLYASQCVGTLCTCQTPLPQFPSIPLPLFSPQDPSRRGGGVFWEYWFLCLGCPQCPMPIDTFLSVYFQSEKNSYLKDEKEHLCKDKPLIIL